MPKTLGPNWNYNEGSGTFSHPEHGAITVKQSGKTWDVHHNGKKLGSFLQPMGAIGAAQKHAKGLAQPTVLKNEELNKGKNQKEQKKAIFGTRAMPAAGSPMRAKHMSQIVNYFKTRYNQDLNPSGGKINPKTGERRDEAPEVGVDKPDWRSGQWEAQSNPDAQVHEGAHLEIMPEGTDLPGGQTLMDKQYADVQRDYGYMKQKQSQHEVQPMAVENKLRRRMGLPANRSGNKVSADAPPRMALEGGPAAVRVATGEGKAVDLLRQARLLSESNKKRIDQVDRGELKWHPTHGWHMADSPDAVINQRARIKAEDPAYQGKDKDTLLRSELEKAIDRKQVKAATIAGAMALAPHLSSGLNPADLVSDYKAATIQDQQKARFRDGVKSHFGLQDSHSMHYGANGLPVHHIERARDKVTPQLEESYLKDTGNPTYPVMSPGTSLQRPKPELEKAAPKGKLLGSDGSKEGIIKGISKFYYGTDVSLHPNSDGTHDVHNSKGKIDGVHVKEHKGRWRFETKDDKTSLEKAAVGPSISTKPVIRNRVTTSSPKYTQEPQIFDGRSVEYKGTVDKSRNKIKTSDEEVGMKKSDPSTKLPGVLLDKNQEQERLAKFKEILSKCSSMKKAQPAPAPAPAAPSKPAMPAMPKMQGPKLPKPAGPAPLKMNELEKANSHEKGIQNHSGNPTNLGESMVGEYNAKGNKAKSAGRPDNDNYFRMKARDLVSSRTKESNDIKPKLTKAWGEVVPKLKKALEKPASPDLTKDEPKKKPYHVSNQGKVFQTKQHLDAYLDDHEEDSHPARPEIKAKPSVGVPSKSAPQKPREDAFHDDVPMGGGSGLKPKLKKDEPKKSFNKPVVNQFPMANYNRQVGLTPGKDAIVVNFKDQVMDMGKLHVPPAKQVMIHVDKDLNPTHATWDGVPADLNHSLKHALRMTPEQIKYAFGSPKQPQRTQDQIAADMGKQKGGSGTGNYTGD